MKKCYAYLLIDENISNIVDSWDECKNIVKGKHARYKSFKSRDEAQNWLDSGAKYEKKSEEERAKRRKKVAPKELPNAIYFDAGTGRGIGVEVRVTTRDKVSIVDETDVFENFGYSINEFGNINVGKDKTNNYGELFGLYLALNINRKLQFNHIMGDSNLVIYFWSLGRANLGDLPKETRDLILEVTRLRDEFERKGGRIEHISGDFNPADLGFHKN